MTYQARRERLATRRQFFDRNLFHGEGNAVAIEAASAPANSSYNTVNITGIYYSYYVLM